MTREEAIYWIENLSSSWDGQYREARDMAIAALREQPRWISVEERPPRRFERVLVWDEEEDAVGEAEYNGEDFKWVEDENIAFATHWMPIPKPPEVPHG